MNNMNFYDTREANALVIKRLKQQLKDDPGSFSPTRWGPDDPHCLFSMAIKIAKVPIDWTRGNSDCQMLDLRNGGAFALGIDHDIAHILMSDIWPEKWTGISLTEGEVEPTAEHAIYVLDLILENNLPSIKGDWI